jgi:membrane fusion protein (multidrug efflux system)
MRKFLTIGIILALAGGAAIYFGLMRREQPASAAGAQQAGQPGGRGGRGGGGFGGMFRPPMTVEVERVKRGDVSQTLTVVGNLIGEQTVDVVPRTGGRITAIYIKLGDRVRRGQVLAKIEDREIVEQVRQAEASHRVAEATIRQREADLNLAQTNVERSRNLFSRQLLPKQTLDDAEARYSSAVAALDLARAQLAQSEARLEELRVNLANTNIVSPVDGFVARRDLDIGAYASTNQPVASVVAISSLRLVANIVEKDLKSVGVGDRAVVHVDAYPGETFNGRVARLSPVLDPATRTAQMEVEIDNPEFRLKPGMYARIDLTVEDKKNVLVVPKVALVDSDGQRGVFQPTPDNRAKFKPVKVGLENAETAEILEGLSEGEVFVSAGAGALRHNDELVIAGMPQGAPGGRGRGQPTDGPSRVPQDGPSRGDRRRSEGAQQSDRDGDRARPVAARSAQEHHPIA